MITEEMCGPRFRLVGPAAPQEDLLQVMSCSNPKPVFPYNFSWPPCPRNPFTPLQIPKPEILRFESDARNPEPGTRNPKSLKLESRNPEPDIPETRNPNPGTRNPNPEAGPAGAARVRLRQVGPPRRLPHGGLHSADRKHDCRWVPRRDCEYPGPETNYLKYETRHPGTGTRNTEH